MPVDQHSPAELVKLGYHYSNLPNEIIREIQDPVALAIWTYLLSMDVTWRPEKEQIMRHFQIGEHTWRRATKVLRDMGLLELKRGGKNRGVKWYVSGIPFDEQPVRFRPPGY